MGVKETLAATATIGQIFLIILNIVFAVSGHIRLVIRNLNLSL